MKKWLFTLLAVALTAAGCGVLSTETREERVAREIREAQLIREYVQSGNFKVHIDRMYPARGMSRSVTDYSVEVKDGVLNSYLPYFGEVWRAPYGGGHGLNFKADIGHYSVEQTRRDGYDIRIYVKTDEDEHWYLLTVFDNGRVSLDVQSVNRDRISYTGEVEFPRE